MTAPPIARRQFAAAFLGKAHGKLCNQHRRDRVRYRVCMADLLGCSMEMASMNLDNQWLIAKIKRDHAAKTAKPGSRVTKAREQDLLEITNRILRRNMRKGKRQSNG